MKQLKHYSLFIIIFVIFIMFIPLITVKAETITKSFVTGNYVNIRTGPGTNYSNVLRNNFNIQLRAGHQVTILSNKKDNNNEIWHEIQFDYFDTTYNGYIKNTYIKTVTYENIEDPAFEQALSEQGFPISYYPQLKELHALYPQWNFIGLNTNLKWKDVVTAQSEVGKSLITGSRNVSYRSTDIKAYNWSTDTWFPLDGSSWYAANKEIVAYYLDPRNFLNEYNILMFEALTYQPAYHTEAVVQKILDGTFMANTYNDNQKYVTVFMNAAQETNTSPIHLASRVRQEQGTTMGAAVDGAYHYCFSNTTSSYYEGSNVYNFFNIGAYSGPNPCCNGLVYAANRGWNSVETSIIEGAKYISNGYINKGQNTLYLQKFNLNPNSSYTLHTHQYMTNIEAPQSEAKTSYNTYENYGVLNEPLTFIIPFFNNMPPQTTLPDLKGNPNNYLKQITINNNNINDFDNSKTEHNLYVPTILEQITLKAEPLNNKATIIKGTGTHNLINTTNTIEIIVKAENNTTRTYTLNIIKTDQVPITISDLLTTLNWRQHNNYISGINLSTSLKNIIPNFNQYNSFINFTIKNNNTIKKDTEKIGTGDQIIINLNNETITQTALLYGDVNGDGEITILDLLIIQKHLLHSKNLKNEYLLAADVNKDGNISLHDLLRVQKHLLKSTYITQ